MARRGSYAKGVAKREEILTSALEVIAREGYGRASVRELAEAVGLSQAGLLHYFGTKEELFAAVLRKRDEADLARSEDETGTRSVFEGFRQTIGRNADVPGLIQLYVRLSAEATDAAHPAHAFFTERTRAFRETVAGDIRRMQAEGTARADVDAEQAAMLLLAAADGLQVQWLTDPTIDMAEHVATLLRLLEPPAAPADA
ncbi:TetR family transcriptional regulator [Agromyces luteolus]|uniref:TetR family transcriptional regulator n=1 Tax=Agromyces luteolus TaxID=88373 RepID=A0A7C9HI14_9MICO|nr:TetR/AcrR family transcriptional regulator [Agromyces luteolus]MUN05644.1 TetR family transcriptional regulator [Agromyces luteolus]GLK26188.1 TetR family transcriptional regulator [Agromyces luteolus]